jgi:hypothetical protein
MDQQRAVVPGVSVTVRNMETDRANQPGNGRFLASIAMRAYSLGGH